MDSHKSPLTLTGFVEQVNDFVRHIHPLNRANAEEIITHVRENMMPKRINVTYEHLSCLEDNNYFRIVLATKRAKANFGIPLVRECNGAIILVEEIPDGDTTVLRCRLVCRPAHDFNPKINNTQWVNTNIKNGLYEIYFIEDGSTVNLSYLQTDPLHKGQWVLSSKNSFDVSNIVWRGKSYGDALAEVLENYPDFSYDNLDPYKTYTIGFKHPSHHPFGQHVGPVLSAWFIQSTNVETGDISYAEKIGLPLQDRTRIAAHSGQFWQAARKKAQNALEDFTNAVQKGDKQRPFLGYILRSRDRNRTRQYSDILVESTLLSEIRNCVYQLPYISNKVLLDQARQNFKNMDHVIIEAYLDSTKRPVFELLFPQYIPRYHGYDKLLDRAIDGIYRVLKKDVHGNKYTAQSNPPSELDKLIATFAPVAAGHISLNVKEKFNIGDRAPVGGTAWPKETNELSQEARTKKLIRTTIVHPKFADKYTQIF
jgi:hypothetical protein